MKNIPWVLVANTSQAHIYHVEKVGVLTQVHVFDNPEGHLHNQDFVDGRPGRSNPSTYRAHSAMEPHHSPKSLENASFAKKICEHLEQSREKGEFSRLYIVAAPTFLGMLRQSLSHGTATLVAGEADKDIVHLKPAEICEVVPFAL
jgi:protein required for attachment to host cells